MLSEEAHTHKNQQRLRKVCPNPKRKHLDIFPILFSKVLTKVKPASLWVYFLGGLFYDLISFTARKYIRLNT